MNKATYTFSLDIRESVAQYTCSVKQGETGRKLIINLREDEKPYMPTADCRAYIYATKPDGTAVINGCIIKLTDGTVMYDCSPQLTTAIGIVECELRVIGANGNIICSPTFLVNVNNTAITDDVVESNSDLQAITDLLTKYERVLEGIAIYSELSSGCYVCHSVHIKASAASVDNLAEVDGYLHIRKDAGGDGLLAYLDESVIVLKYIPADLQNITTTRVDIEGIESIENKVTSVSSSSTDTQYPSAKAVHLIDEALRAYVDGKTIVDTAMSDSSTHPVQNKIVKDYIDSKVVPGGIIDTVMSNSSPNAVQNKVIKDYVDSRTLPSELWTGEAEAGDTLNISELADYDSVIIECFYNDSLAELDGATRMLAYRTYYEGFAMYHGIGYMLTNGGEDKLITVALKISNSSPGSVLVETVTGIDIPDGTYSTLPFYIRKIEGVIEW